MSASLMEVSPEQLQGELVESENLVVVGRPYISYYVFRFPPWNQGLVDWAIKHMTHSPFSIEGIVFDDVYSVSPSALVTAAQGTELPFRVPPEFKSGRGKPWMVVVKWRKVSEPEQRPSESGADVIVKAIASVGLGVLGFLTFRAFTQSAGKIRELAEDTVFSPGFVIAALVAIALIFGGLRK